MPELHAAAHLVLNTYLPTSGQALGDPPRPDHLRGLPLTTTAPYVSMVRFRRGQRVAGSGEAGELRTNGRTKRASEVQARATRTYELTRVGARTRARSPARATRTYERAHERAHEVPARATRTNRRTRVGRVVAVSNGSRRGLGSQRATDERQALLESILRWGLVNGAHCTNCRTQTAARPVLSVHDRY